MNPNQEQEINNFISLSEASKATGYHPDYLGFLCRAGRLKGFRIGRNWFTTKSELGEFIKNYKNGVSEVLDETGTKIPVHTQAAETLNPLILENQVATSDDSVITEAAATNPNLTAESKNVLVEAPILIPSEEPGKNLNHLKKEVLESIDKRIAGLDSSIKGFEAKAAELAEQQAKEKEKQSNSLPVVPVIFGAATGQSLNNKFSSNFDFGKPEQVANSFGLQEAPGKHLFKTDIKKLYDSFIRRPTNGLSGFATAVAIVALIGFTLWSNFAGQKQVADNQNVTKIIYSGQAGSGPSGQNLNNQAGSPSSSTTVINRQGDNPSSAEASEGKKIINQLLGLNQAQVFSLIDQRLNQYLAEGKFIGPPGPAGAQGASGSSGFQGGITTFPPVPGNNFPGATVFSVTDLSAHNAAFQNLNVSGPSAFTGPTTFNSNVSLLGSTSITSLSVGNLNPGFNQGSVVFEGVNGLAQDNAKLFYDASSTALGIGTSTPGQTLTVAGNGLVTGNFTVLGTTNFGSVSLASSTIGTLVVTASAALPTTTITNLTVSATSTLATTSVTALTASGNVTFSTLTPGSILFAGVGGLINQNNGNFFWDNSNKYFNIGTNTVASTLAIQGSGAVNPFTIASSTGTNLVTVSPAGYVGVGTTLPTTLLTLGDGVTNQDFLLFNSARAWKFRALGSGGSTSLDLKSTSAGKSFTISGSDDSQLFNFTANVSAPTFGAASTSVIGFMGGTSVLDTGISRNAAGALEVNNGTVGTWRDLIARNYSANTTSTSTVLTVQGLGGKDVVDISSSTGASIFHITQAGNVGIGTVSPSQLLTVGNNNQFTLDSSGNAKLNGSLTFGGTGTPSIANSFGNGLRFAASGLGGVLDIAILSTGVNLNSSLFLANSGGNVGIGTTSPSSFKLQVQGDIGPDRDLTYNLGGPTLRWNNVYSNTINGTNLTVTGTTTLATTTISDLTVTNNATIGNNLTVSGGSVVIGNSTTTTLTVNANINSNLVPSVNNMFDVGSASFFWHNGYFNNINVNSISAASSSIAGTQSNDFTINTDNGTPDTETMNLIFFRGTVVPNALLTWNSATKRFEFNQAGFFQNASGSTTETTLVVKGNAGQTADIFQVASSSGSNLFTVTPGGNVTIATETAGSVLFAGAGGLLNQNNSNFFWDNTNNRLGIGTPNPGTQFEVVGTAGSLVRTASFLTPSMSNNQQNYFTIGNSNGNNNAFAFLYNHNSTASSRYLNIGSFEQPSNGLTLTAAGNAGINNTSPQYTLDVKGIAGNGNPFNVASSSGTSELMVSNSGNVGIGSTTPAAKLVVTGSGSGTGIALRVTDFNNVPKLTVTDSGVTTLDAVAGGTGNLILKNTSNTAATGALGISGGANNIINGDAAGDFDIYSSQKLLFSANSGTNAQMVLTSSGNVGINTTTPTAKLDVYGSGTTNPFNVSSSTGASELIVTSAGNVGIGTTSPGSKLDIWGNLNVATSSTPALFVNTATGQVGIGTNNPGRPLDVVAVGNLPAARFEYAGGSGSIEILGNSGSGAQVIFGNQSDASINSMIGSTGSAAKDLRFSVNGNQLTSPAMTILSSGNVGIGTTGPTSKLDIFGPNNQGFMSLNDTSNSNKQVFSFTSSADNGRMIINDASGNAQVNLQAGNGSSYLNGGNVGINTTTPANRLQVVGDIGFGSGGNTVGNAVFYNASNLNTVSLKASTTSASYTLALPTAQGATGSVLTNDGSGNLSFTSTSTIVGGLAFVQGGNSFATQALLGTNDNNNLAIETNGNQRAIITSAGLFGFNSSTPGSFFSVQGSSTNVNIPIFSIASSNNSSLLTVLANGNVGIGTTTPGQLLTVASSSNVSAYFQGYIGVGYGSPQASLDILADSNAVVPGIRIRQSNVPTTRYWDQTLPNTGGTVALQDSVTNSATTYYSFFTGQTGQAGVGQWSGLGPSVPATLPAFTVVTGALSAVGQGIEVTDVTGANPRMLLEITTATSPQATTSPAVQILHLNSTGDLGLAARGSAASNILFYTSPDAGTTGLLERIRITSAGNLGLGTTTPIAALQVTGPAVNDNGSSNNITRGIYVSPNPTNAANTLQGVDYRGLEVAGYTLNLASTTAISQTYSALFNQPIVNTTTIATLANASNVYINGAPKSTSNLTITSSTALTIVGGAVTSTTNATALYVTAPTGATNNYAALFNGGNVGIGSATPIATLAVKGAASGAVVATFDVSSSTDASMFRVNSNGNVGIGMTNPAYTLDVTGTLHTSSNALINGIYMGLNYPDSMGNFTDGSMVRFNNSDLLLKAFVAGNVGVNTTTPTAKLDVYGSGTTNPFNVASSSGTSELIVTSGGNVGIGTTTPGRTLTVVGDMRATGILYDSTNSAGTTGMVLQTSGTAYTWVATSTLGISGGSGVTGGANGYVARFTSATALATSTIIDNGTVTGVNASSATVSLLVQGTTTLNPFQINSSTGVSLLRVSANGSLGLGTTTNAVTLSIQGTSTLPTLDLFDVSSSSGTSILRVTSGGNVGIGTAAPGEKLTVSQNTTTLPAPPSVTVARFANSDGNSTRVVIDAYGTGSSGNLTFRSARGTAASQSALQGTDQIGQLAFLGFGSSTYSSLASAFVRGSAAANWTDSDQSTFLSFGTTPASSTSVSERMRIDSAGNVGINTTTPLAKLAIQGTAGANDILDVASSTGASVLRVTKSGNVGIGTTTPGVISTAGPTRTLDVEGSSGITDIMSGSSDASGAGLSEQLNNGAKTLAEVVYGSSFAGSLFGVNKANDAFLITYNSTAALTVGTVDSAPLTLGTASIARMTIASAGNIGIGTTTPNALLTLQPAAASGAMLWNIASTTGASMDLVSGYGGFVQNISSSTAINIMDGSTTPSQVFVVDTTQNSNNAGMDITAGGAQSGNLLNFFSSGGTQMLAVTAVGGISQNISSTTALQILNGSGIQIFAVDSVDKFLLLATSSTPTMTVDGQIAVGNGDTTSTGGRIWVRSGGTTFRFTSDANTADYSEFFYQSSASTQDVGTVMTVDNSTTTPVSDAGMVKLATSSYDSNLLGAVTDKGTSNNNPDDTRQKDPHFVNVGMLGHIKVKLTDENGPIQPGDFLTSSAQFPGYAMKATRSGQVIGTSLVDFPEAADLAALQPQSSQTPVAQSSSTTDSVIDSVATSTSASSTQGGPTSTDTGSASARLTPATTTTFIHKGHALTLVNPHYQILNNTFVLGDNDGQLSSATSTNGVAQANSFLIDQKGSGNILQLQQNEQDRFLVAPSGSVSILANSTSTAQNILSVVNASTTLFTINSVGDAAFVGHIIVGKDTAGTATIKAGDNKVSVTFAASYNSLPKIVVTAQGVPGFFYGVINKTATGFTIAADRALTADMSFDWVALAQPVDTASQSGLDLSVVSSPGASPAPVPISAPTSSTDTSATSTSGTVAGTSTPPSTDTGSSSSTTTTTSDSGTGTSSSTPPSTTSPAPAPAPSSTPDSTPAPVSDSGTAPSTP